MSPVEFARRVIGGNRAIASRITPYFARTPLTPNQITTLSLAAGLAAAFCFTGGTRASLFEGAALLQLSFILDNCDGDIARLKGLSSSFGMWFDFVCDLLVEFAVWTGLALGAVAQGLSARQMFWLAGAACLASFLNFLRVIWERICARPSKKSFAGAGGVFDALSHDGDPTLFIWIMAAAGYPGYFLLLGASYMGILWIVSLFRSR